MRCVICKTGEVQLATVQAEVTVGCDRLLVPVEAEVCMEPREARAQVAGHGGQRPAQVFSPIVGLGGGRARTPTMATTAQEILHILEENAPAIRTSGVRSLGLFGSTARGAGRQ